MKIFHEGTHHTFTVYEFSDLVGKTLIHIHNIDDRITFETDNGIFQLSHTQDCCEHVYVESIVGDLQDLIGTPVLVAEERSDNYDPPDVIAVKEEVKANGGSSWEEDSQTWTFYTIRTIKGTVDIRWHGSSNGYYSEGVDFSLVQGHL